MATTAEIAWAAGLFEGEGCIEIRRNWRSDSGRNRQTTRMHLGMTDEDVVKRFHEIVGCGSVRMRRLQNDRWKSLHVWTIGSATDVATVLGLFLPYLGERRKGKALETLRFLAELETDRHRTCFCGKPFYTRRTRKVTCSNNCYQALRRLLREVAYV